MLDMLITKFVNCCRCLLSQEQNICEKSMVSWLYGLVDGNFRMGNGIFDNLLHNIMIWWLERSHNYLVSVKSKVRFEVELMFLGLDIGSSMQCNKGMSQIVTYKGIVCKLYQIAALLHVHYTGSLYLYHHQHI